MQSINNKVGAQQFTSEFGRGGDNLLYQIDIRSSADCFAEKALIVLRLSDAHPLGYGKTLAIELTELASARFECGGTSGVYGVVNEINLGVFDGLVYIDLMPTADCDPEFLEIEDFLDSKALFVAKACQWEVYDS